MVECLTRDRGSRVSASQEALCYVLYMLMSWPADMDMLWLKFLNFASFFFSVNLSCYMQQILYPLLISTQEDPPPPP